MDSTKCCTACFWYSETWTGLPWGWGWRVEGSARKWINQLSSSFCLKSGSEDDICRKYYYIAGNGNVEPLWTFDPRQFGLMASCWPYHLCGSAESKIYYHEWFFFFPPQSPVCSVLLILCPLEPQLSDSSGTWRGLSSILCSPHLWSVVIWVTVTFVSAV